MKLIGTQIGGLSNGPIPDPHVLLTLKPRGDGKGSLSNLEIDDNVNRARLIRHFLALNVGLENRTTYAKALHE